MGSAVDLLRPILPADLRKFWPWLRAGLEEIAARYAVEWIPEDIYGTLRSGQAVAYIVGDDEAGFVILQQQARFTGPCLLVWVIWGELKQYEPDLYDELEEIARSINAATIEAQGREGWGRRGFFTPCERIFRRKLGAV